MANITEAKSHPKTLKNGKVFHKLEEHFSEAPMKATNATIVKNIVIVGGGTRAWFTLSIHPGITPLVDKEVGTPVGVGEGTLLNFNDFMANCGITTQNTLMRLMQYLKVVYCSTGAKKIIQYGIFWLDEVYKNESQTSVYESWTSPRRV